MKTFFKSIFLLALTVALSGVVSSCKDDDGEFVHDDNLINQLFMMTTQQGTQYSFTISEYDAQGNLVTEDITPERVEGGYGMAYIEFPISSIDDFDLTRVYLVADVSYDVIFLDKLTGTHDITGDGIVVRVKGGNGHVRKYRIYGAFN